MIYIGSDHAGYELKQIVKKHLEDHKMKVIDLGVFAAEPPADYPDIASEVAEKVMENHGARGILVCGTGIGMCMTANKFPGIRAAVVESKKTAEMSRKHNDSNILCLGGRIVDSNLALEIVDAYFSTDFENEERHVRRVNKIDRRNSSQNK